MALAVRRIYWFVILERIIYDFLDCFLHIKLFFLFELFQNYMYMCCYFFIVVKYTKQNVAF